MTGTLLFVSACAFFVSIVGATRAPRLWLLASLGGALASLAASAAVLVGFRAWSFRTSFTVGGEAAHLELDGLSALFLALLSVVSGAASAYAHEYWSDATHPASAAPGRRWLSTMVLAMGVVLLSANGLHFLLAWEAFTVSAYFLITLDARKGEVRKAGWLYLAASHLGTLALFGFFTQLAARTGSWELALMRDRPELAPLLWLALLGFGVKAGLFPLHFWLPSAHASAPSHVSAVLSGMAIKMGIYGIARFSGLLPVPEAVAWVVIGLGVASAVLGVAFALGQHDLKRLLAYHSVENVGIISIGLGFSLLASGEGATTWGQFALLGGLLHVWNHGLFKSLLFLGAGSVVHATGTRDMSRLGGLWRAMPFTAAFFALGAAAISGLPPLNGFVSELLLYLGLLGAARAEGAPSLAAVASLVLLAMTGAMALACFVKASSVVFLGAARSAESRHECGPWMRAPMFALSAGCIAIGLFPFLFWPALHAAAASWRGVPIPAPVPGFLVSLATLHVALALVAGAAVLLLWRRSHRFGWSLRPTWDCGYAQPSASMQYTAGSFAGIITDWFSWILKPVRQEVRPTELFPESAYREDHTSETVLERVVEPAGRLLTQLSSAARRLQHGRVQAYLFYIITGLAIVAALALAGATV